jgi:uncharacterized protein (DUF2236 family)
LQRPLESAARGFLYADSGSETDFACPVGEPALTAPDSVTWRVFKNPLALLIGGIAAVILELAEPRVRTGVWEHTSFRRDPLRRVQRTGLAAMITVYGPRSAAEAMIARVDRVHRHVRGMTSSGQPYRADDPELLVWVHATASFGFLQAYHAYVHALDESECDSYYRDGRSSADLYGARDVPLSQSDANALFEAMRGKLERSPVIFEFLGIMRHARILPWPLSWLQEMAVKGAVELLPAWVRELLGLSAAWDLRPWQRRAIRLGGAAADRLLLRCSPAVQACRRLGLPDDYLYARRPE